MTLKEKICKIERYSYVTTTDINMHESKKTKRGVNIIVTIILAVIVAAFVGASVGYVMRKRTAESQIGSAEAEAKRIVDDAAQRGETKKKEALLEAKEDIHRLRQELDRETKERRSELQRQERRVVQKEENLDRKLDSIEKREESLSRKEARLDKSQAAVNEMHEQQKAELERISGLTAEEARTTLMAEAEEELKHEKAMKIKEYEQQVKDESDKKAREILSTAIQRCAADHVAETTVSVVALPNDEMKGRIIGREGRNIRTLETLTGIDLIIDDTPEAVILSGFDPVRREIARIALEKLIQDGRIHPARIEEMVEKAKREVDQRIKEAGEQATFETGVHGLHPELVRLLGRLSAGDCAECKSYRGKCGCDYFFDHIFLRIKSACQISLNVRSVVNIKVVVKICVSVAKLQIRKSQSVRKIFLDSGYVVYGYISV